MRPRLSASLIGLAVAAGVVSCREGPVPELAGQVRELHRRFHGGT